MDKQEVSGYLQLLSQEDLSAQTKVILCKLCLLPYYEQLAREEKQLKKHLDAYRQCVYDFCNEHKIFPSSLPPDKALAIVLGSFLQVPEEGATIFVAQWEEDVFKKEERL